MWKPNEDKVKGVYVHPAGFETAWQKKQLKAAA
jgi:hypothetical protein